MAKIDGSLIIEEGDLGRMAFHQGALGSWFSFNGMTFLSFNSSDHALSVCSEMVRQIEEYKAKDKANG